MSAYDEIEKVGEGQVQRYIVDLENFSEKVLEKKKKEENPL